MTAALSLFISGSASREDRAERVPALPRNGLGYRLQARAAESSTASSRGRPRCRSFWQPRCGCSTSSTTCRTRALAVVLPLGTVLCASGWVMFDVHAGSEGSRGLGGGGLLRRCCCAPARPLDRGAGRASPRCLCRRMRLGRPHRAGRRAGPAELAQLGTSFNTMAGSLEVSSTPAGSLVAWASHDLKAPLA